MIIEIKIEKGQITLFLKQKGQIIYSLDFPEERQLSEKLLPAIDSLLRKNKLETKDIAKIEVRSDLGDNFTTYRIAKSVAEAWNFGNKNM